MGAASEAAGAVVAGAAAAAPCMSSACPGEGWTQYESLQSVRHRCGRWAQREIRLLVLMAVGRENFLVFSVSAIIHLSQEFVETMATCSKQAYMLSCLQPQPISGNWPGHQWRQKKRTC